MNGGEGVLSVEEGFEVVKWNGDVAELSVDIGAGVLFVESDDFWRAEAIIFFRDLRGWPEGFINGGGCCRGRGWRDLRTSPLSFRRSSKRTCVRSFGTLICNQTSTEHFIKLKLLHKC